MALLSETVGQVYAERQMPAAKMGTGPWGEAIRYWLGRRNMRQSDLANETGVERKTISSITRGFHTTTRVLEKVAIAFQVSLDDILISPARREANEERKRLLREAFEDTWRRYEDPGPLALPAKSSEAGLTDKHLNLEIQERKEKHRKAEEQARRKARYQGKAPKQRRFPHLK